MKAFPFESYRFSVLTVERPAAELQRLLEAQGYMYVCDHGAFGDQLWVDQRATEAATTSSPAGAAATPSPPPAPKKALLDLSAVNVEVGPTVRRFSDVAGAVDSRGKRCDLGLYTGLFGTQPKRKGRAAGLAAGRRRP
jgi:hypothetical protein